MSHPDEQPGLDPTDDETPFGDTDQHSESETEGDTETGRVQPDSGRFKRDPIGGEAEAEPSLPADPPQP